MNNYMENYEKWLASPTVDSASKDELRSLAGNEDEIKMRFSDYMEFGTGGLRAKMGAGTNMMNTYTVAHATEGVARLIETLGDDARQEALSSDATAETTPTFLRAALLKSSPLTASRYTFSTVSVPLPSFHSVYATSVVSQVST